MILQRQLIRPPSEIVGLYLVVSEVVVVVARFSNFQLKLRMNFVLSFNRPLPDVVSVAEGNVLAYVIEGEVQFLE